MKKTGKNHNHYLAGRRAWAEMYGSFIQERNQWRMSTLVALLVLVLLCIGNIVLAMKEKVVPYVYEVDRAGRVSGAVMAQKLDTSEQIIQFSLSEFITSWRTVTADIALQERFVKRTSFMAIGSAKGFLREWYSNNNPYKSSEKKLIEVRIPGLPLYVSGETWLVEWEEIERSHEGLERSRSVYQANLVVKRKLPETEEEIKKNAAGIYISEIRHSRKRK